MKSKKGIKGNNLVNLKEFREKLEKISKNAPQSEVEEKTGMPIGKLTRIYNGYDALTVDHLISIAQAYNCSVDTLLGSSIEHKAKDYKVSDLLEILDYLQRFNLVDVAEYRDLDKSIYIRDDTPCLFPMFDEFHAGIKVVLREYLACTRIRHLDRQKFMELLKSNYKDTDLKALARNLNEEVFPVDWD